MGHARFTIQAEIKSPPTFKISFTYPTAIAILKNMSHMRILLVDDHEVVRLGLKSLLERQISLEVIAEASTQEEAVRMAQEHQPDIVLMDIRLSGGSGIEA